MPPRHVLLLLCALCGTALHAQPAPEAASGWTPKALARAQRDLVVAAHPLAVEAALQMLARGGSAVDAAIAAQLVLNVVEPQSSGIGGGGFLVHYDAQRRRVQAYDGRETAPAAADASLLLDADGKPLPFAQARNGGRAVGTPGLLAMLDMAHREHGRLPWASLFAPAIAIAQRGFAISPRLARAIAADADALCAQPATKAYFCTAEGAPKPAGSVLVNRAFAATLQAIARGGAQAFYHGPLAADLVAAVQSDPRQPGRLALKDLAQYRARARDPLCGTYRSRFTICGIGPPSSGTATVLATLGMLEAFPLASYAPLAPEAVHLISEAFRLAYADRAQYLADADFVAVPLAGLLDPDYLRQRAQRIDPLRTLGEPAPGLPAGAPPRGHDRALEPASTTHISIVDRAGNAVALTSSIEHAFGSRIFVRGFLLNNQLTDFSFAPTDAAGRPLANRIEPGKRPRSSMAPTLVFDRDGALRLVLGSPGGAHIIHYVTKVLIAVLDWGLDVQQAIDLPNFGAFAQATTWLERDRAPASLAEALQARGHAVAFADLPSGLHAIARLPDGSLAGGADPRREGVARGDSHRLRPPPPPAVQVR